MTVVKFLFVSFVVLVSFTSCYDEYTNDYETPNMGFAVANPLRTVIADRDMPIYIGVSIAVVNVKWICRIGQNLRLIRHW